MNIIHKSFKQLSDSILSHSLNIFSAGLLLFGAFPVSAQIIKWQNTIGGNGSDNLSNVIPVSDGGYLLTGFSNSGISGDKTAAAKGSGDAWVVKLDPCGNLSWQKTIGGDSFEEGFQSLQQTSDGGFILSCTSNSNVSGDKNENSQGGVDYWVVKLDVNGNIVWQNTIGGSGEDRMKRISQTADGGYIVLGISNSNISGDKTENRVGDYDYWVIKLDAIGDIEWQNTIGGSSREFAGIIQQTPDGGYLIAAGSSSNISGDKTENSVGGIDIWLIKLDASGNIIWQNTIGGNANDIPEGLAQTADGGYLIAAHCNSNQSGDKTQNNYNNAFGDGYDIWLIKVDGSGNLLWDKIIGGSGFETVYSLQQTADGNYLIGAYSDSNISGDKTENKKGESDYWPIKIDPDGAILWQKTIGGGQSDYLFAATEAPNGNIILGGYSNSVISGDKTEPNYSDPWYNSDYWVVCLGPESITASSNAPLCTGSGDLFLTVSSSNAVGWNWTGPAGFVSNEQSPILTNPVPVNSGNYTVVVTDVNGCTSSQTLSVMIHPAPPLMLEFTVVPYPPSCNGTNDGVLGIINPTGGTPPYSFALNGGSFQINPVFDDLGAGTFTVVLKDAHACTANVQAIIPPGPIDPIVVACPTVVPNLQANSHCQATLGDYTGLATLSGGCGIPLNPMVQTPPPGTLVNPGTVAITLTVSNTAGQSASCVFNVTVSGGCGGN